MKERIVVYGGGTIGMLLVMAAMVWAVTIMNQNTKEEGTYSEDITSPTEFDSFTFEGTGKFTIK